MPAYDNVSLSTDIILAGYGALIGGPTFETEVVSTSGGTEQRNNLTGPHARRRFRLNTAPMPSATRTIFYNFFASRNGSNRSFRFKDPFDYIATAQPVVGGQLVKRYTIGAYTYDRPITKPINAISLSGGGSVDYATGIVSGGSGGTWTGEFEIQARFDDDGLQETGIHTGVSDSAWSGAVPIIETFDSDIPIVSNTTPPTTLASVSFPVPVEVGRQDIPTWNTYNWSTGYYEERFGAYSASRTIYKGSALLSDETDLTSLLSLFLIARARRSVFTYNTQQVRFGSDALNIYSTGHHSYKAELSLVQA